jgi:acetolactate synthase-1/2/3 large subunit
MGWAIGASVGVALCTRNTPVVCFTGDGCFLMSGQEITVAVAERLPVIFVVLNDHAYGMIRHAHRLEGTEPVDFAIPPVDFCMMAKEVGANAYTIRHPEDFELIDYQALCSRNGPTLLDVYIDPEEAPPLGMV